jgi:hypothetical protein
MDMAHLKKAAAPHAVEPRVVPKLVRRLADGAVTRVPASVGCNGKISAARAARIRRAGPSMKLLERHREIREAQRQAAAESGNLQPSSVDQGAEIAGPVLLAHRTGGFGCRPQRRKAGFGEAERRQSLELARDVEVLPRDRGPRRELGLAGIGE